MTRIPAFLKSYSDSSFTNPHQVALPETPPDCTGDFTHMGAKYWGFETKRHIATTINATKDGFNFNADGHHWLHLGLAFRSKITSLSVSTKWFTGNQVPVISVLLTDKLNGTTATVITKERLAPDAEHQFDIDPTWATDCKVLCYHEGGISQVNLFGDQGAPLYQQENILEHAEISHISNEHYGRPADVVIGKREQDYMFGWESARTGFGEHALFKLQQKTNIATIIVDTYLHRLNPPLSCHVFGADLSDADLASLSTLPASSLPQWKIVFPDQKEIVPDDFRDYMGKQSYLELGYSEFEIKLHLPDPDVWKTLISFGQLYPDTWHEYNDMATKGAMNAIYYMHFPHGGIHGLKIYSS
jgi:allantoicase